jgi:uncharacterized coiled-coil DUF342 family protein
VWIVAKWLLGRWQVWVAVIAIVGLVVGWGAIVGKWRTWRLDLPGSIREVQDAEKAVADAKKELATTQAVVAEMAKKIAQLKAEADRFRREADMAEARSRAFAEQAQGLRDKVAQLEAARRAQKPVRGAREASQALVEMGY